MTSPSSRPQGRSRDASGRPIRIQSAAVLGAGVMGAQIAAHLANAGVHVRLFDLTAGQAAAGLDRVKNMTPAPFFVPANAALVSTGSFDDLTPLASADWIIEAVVEQLDVKQALLARVDAVRSPRAIVSTNTSGLSVAAIAEGRSDAFRRHWLGTHFFNPPRYLRLVEIIPIAETDPSVAAAVSEFIAGRLGKVVVTAPDAPAFIANRIGLFGVARLLDAVARGGYSIEEIDALTGPLIGRPKSATFRTIDIAGLDILAHVAADLSRRLPPPENAQFALPPFVQGMIERGLLGDKTGQGFYKKVKTERGSSILTLNLDTFEYGPPAPVHIPSLDVAKGIDDLGERLRFLAGADDKGGRLMREAVLPTVDYASARSGRPGALWASAADVDAAMRAGFGWDLGPIETAGVLAGRAPESATFLSRTPVVRRNAAASLRDLGDGVLAVEFHSKMNTIGGDTIEMLHAAITEAAANFEALVIGNDALNFSAGANLMLVLLSAQGGEWDDIDLMVRAFQGATMAVKTSPVPVVAAPAGLALGGGCELSMHADRIQAHAETYMGLVEVGVGLLPAGGGTKEMLLRSGAERAFETIGFGKVSTSAADACAIGYLRDVDGVTMNRDRLLDDAKAVALGRVRAGYAAPAPRTDIRVGGPDTYARLALGVHLAWRAGRISDHDARIGRAIARVLAGGDVPSAGTITEQQMLDLEREGFLSLCGERRTLERIAAMLKSGKALRN